MGHFRANSKALAELEGEGIAKVLFNKDTEEILGVHIIGLHAADLIQECANAMCAKTTVREIAMMVRYYLVYICVYVCVCISLLLYILFNSVIPCIDTFNVLYVYVYHMLAPKLGCPHNLFLSLYLC